MKCPKCGYARKTEEAAPEWQCPSCGVAYAKADAARNGEERARRRESSGSSFAGKFLLVAVFSVAISWALVSGTRHGSGSVRQGDIASASVVMYSLTTCGYCNAKRAELNARGIPFVEYFIDKEPDRQRELFEKLLVSGYRGGGIGTPTFEVNGKMLPNNPSLDTIIKNL